jgi:hypothetical protein
MTTPNPTELSQIFALLARSNKLCGMLSGWELAAERGNLSPQDMEDLAAMRSEAATTREAAATRWSKLPECEPESVGAYDALVDAILGSTTPAADATFTEAVKERAPATRSPTREFDPWAIWAVLHVGQANPPAALD